ncbi:MAG: DUF1573 domain-containing protein [Planctomycetota bacterium]|nr:MAG: DUF1573 domain-containing protein [Planctomycetota bacterium]
MAMKSYGLIFCLVLCLAVGLGGIVRQIEEKPVVRPGQEAEYRRVQMLLQQQAEALQQPTEARPRLVCAQREFDFGDMDPFAEAYHDFLIENRGNQDLIIRPGEITCSCTTIELGVTSIPPGGQQPVRLRWRTGGSGREFHQAATLHTNDPASPVLVLRLHGRVRVTLAANISELVLQNIAPGGSATSHFLVGSEVWESFHIERLETTDPNLEVRLSERRDETLQNGLQEVAEVVVTVRPHGQRGTGYVRIFVRPPADWEDREEREGEASGMKWQPDGTALVEVPVHYAEMRRMSLYGDCLETHPQHLNLGRVRLGDAPRKSWTLYARFRGLQQVRGVHCAIEGIDGLVADVRLLEGGTRVGQTAVIRLHFDDRIRPATYDRFHPGSFRLQAEGIEDEREEVIELPVRLSVLADDA